MKRVLSIAMILVGVVAGGVVAPVTFGLADDASMTAATSTAAPATSKAELDARLAERRARLKIKLNAADSTALKAKCKASQVNIATVATKTGETNRAYQTKVDALLKKLQETSQTFKSSGKDTAALDAQIATAGQKYQTYRGAADSFNLSLSDLGSVDCVAEPNGFKSTLEDARTQLNTVKTSRQDTTKYVKETIVPTLKSLGSTQ